MTDETESTEETETAEVEGQPEDISSLFDEGAEHPEGEASEKGEAETEESEDDQAESEETDEETGESEETEEAESETPSEEEGSVPRRALIDERRKRQDLEKQVQELRQKHEPDEEAPDPTDDPEGYEKYLRAKWEKEQWEKTANRSREKAMETHPDYEEKERHFLFLASQDPELVRQMNEDPDPASFAYTKAKESLDAQEKAVEERVVERLRKEGKIVEEKPGKKKSAEAASQVSDLTNASGAGKNTEETVTESENPEDVFGDLKY